MSEKTSLHKSNSNVGRGNTSDGSNRSSSSHRGTIRHSAVHKPVPGKGGKKSK